MHQGERPTSGLTRRQLRAMREAAEGPAEGAEGAAEGAEGAAEGADGAAAAVDPSSAGPAPVEPSSGAPRAAPSAPEPTFEDIIEDTVELPRRLPPEPDVDDVRWGAPVPGIGVRVPIAERTGELPVVPAAQQTEPEWAPVRGAGPSPFPTVSEADLSPEGFVAGPGVRPAADTDRAAEPAWEGAADGFEGPTRRSRRALRDSEDVGEPDDVAPVPPGPVETSPEPDDVPGEERDAGPDEASDPVPDPVPDAVPDAVPGAVPGPVPGAVPLSVPGAVPAPNASWAHRPAELPTLDDLLAKRPEPRSGPAELGWRGAVRRLSGGLIAPEPGPRERDRRRAVAAVQRSLDGPRTIVVINPKGGAHKTTATLLIAATFGEHRRGYTLAWDNNETRGTLGWRSAQVGHQNTAVNLLQDLDRFADTSAAHVGDLDGYVRRQRAAGFDVLASDEDAASAASIDAFAFRSLHRTLARFYRVMLVDTGNNMRASNWQAALDAADQVVIVSTVREDTAQSAAWAVDALRATGHEDVVRNAVTVLSAPAAKRDEELSARLHEHFGSLTRTVLDVPYDPALVPGTPIDYGALSDATRDAWLRVTAAIADGL